MSDFEWAHKAVRALLITSLQALAAEFAALAWSVK